MKLLIQNNRVIGTATDGYAGLSDVIDAPLDFDVDRMGNYVVTKGVLSLAVPQAVSMRQARLALLGAGLLAGVNAALASLPSPKKEAAEIEWEFATEVKRTAGLVPAMAGALGLTNAQIDALFVTAATL